MRRETYGPCQDGSEVVLYAVEGGGHTWPGGPKDTLMFSGRVTHDLSATEVLWAFFMKHSRPVRVVRATKPSPANVFSMASAPTTRALVIQRDLDAACAPTFQDRLVWSVNDLLSSVAQLAEFVSTHGILLIHQP